MQSADSAGGSWQRPTLHLRDALGVMIGLLLIVFALYLAVAMGSPVWYTPYVLGSFLFFGVLNIWKRRPSTLTLLLSNPSLFCRLWGALVLFGFVIDVPLGRWVGDLWIYPQLTTFQQIPHVWLIGYPFAFLSAIETAGFFVAFAPPPQGTPLLRARKVAWPIIILSVLLIVLALFYRIGGDFVNARRVLFILLFVSTFFMDAIAALRCRPSLISSLSLSNVRRMLVFATVVLAVGLSHEVPNTYALEWIYQNVPFISMELFGVNVLVLTIGWLFLVLGPLALVELLLPTSIQLGIWSRPQ